MWSEITPKSVYWLDVPYKDGISSLLHARTVSCNYIHNLYCYFTCRHLKSANFEQESLTRYKHNYKCQCRYAYTCAYTTRCTLIQQNVAQYTMLYTVKATKWLHIALHILSETTIIQHFHTCAYTYNIRNEVRDSSSEEAAKLNDDELIALAKSILHSRNSAHKRTVRSADEAPTESNATVTNSTDQEGMANTSLQAKVSNTSSLAEVSNSSVQAEGASNASSPIHTVSNVSRLVSYGYNLIRGCPDEYRGLDGGIRTSLPIFKFTFNQGKSDPYFNSATSLPDQVYFEPHMDKALTTSHNIYGGEKSYRDTMITGVSAAGKNLHFFCPWEEFFFNLHGHNRKRTHCLTRTFVSQYHIVHPC